jgi:hypothetical protein
MDWNMDRWRTERRITGSMGQIAKRDGSLRVGFQSWAACAQVVSIKGDMILLGEFYSALL